MKITRKWSMPNKETFSIKPINDLANHYINGELWLDPFAGNCDIATITNDLNPETTAKYHLDYKEFLKLHYHAYGIIFDPPYSPTQIKRKYDSIGLKMSQEDGRGFYSHLWKEAIRIKPEYIIQCGWHTNGKKEYYDLVEILIVSHGGQHYDTLVSVWKKNQEALDKYFTYSGD